VSRVTQARSFCQFFLNVLISDSTTLLSIPLSVLKASQYGIEMKKTAPAALRLQNNSNGFSPS
jgi:hypothetical protein